MRWRTWKGEVDTGLATPVEHYTALAREAAATSSNPAHIHVYKMYDPVAGQRLCSCGQRLEVVR